MQSLFKNRFEAGRQLADRLSAYRRDEKALLVGLARGGIVVAAGAASVLKLPLTVMVVRKLGSPISSELAIGAITDTGAVFLDEEVIAELNVSKDYIAQEMEKEKRLAASRSLTYKKNAPPLSLKDHAVILVDDGIATGSTMAAAIASAREAEASKVIVAAPVIAAEAHRKLKNLADECIVLITPASFYGISEFYEDFHQVEDAEVLKFLNEFKI